MRHQTIQRRFELHSLDAFYTILLHLQEPTSDGEKAVKKKKKKHKKDIESEPSIQEVA